MLVADIRPNLEETSAFANISLHASIIQGSSLGPASFIITAGDLRPLNDDSHVIKFADDTYLIIPATNSSTSDLEIDHIRSWAASNNLLLNRTKSKELVFYAQRARLNALNAAQPPPLCQGIERVESLTALGVTVNSRLSAAEHVTNVLASCSGLLHALRILRTHGMSSDASVTATVQMTLPISELFSDADDQLFSRISHNVTHVRKPLLQFYLHRLNILII